MAGNQIAAVHARCIGMTERTDLFMRDPVVREYDPSRIAANAFSLYLWTAAWNTGLGLATPHQAP